MSNTDKSTSASALFESYLDEKLGGGKGKKTFLADVDNIYIEKFPTGSLKLDIELLGGYPKGTIIEFIGPTGSSKSTLCIEGVAQHQKKYPKSVTLWLDLEGVFDKIYFENIGVDTSPERFILAQPVKGEEAFEMMRLFCEKFPNGLMVVDSVTMLLPAKEAEGDIGDAQMALHARLMAKGIRNVMPILRDNNVTAFFINQERTKLGVTFGDPMTGTGGVTLPYFTRTRIKTGRQNSQGEAGNSIGVSYKTMKANFGRENVVVNTKVIFGRGIDYITELFDLALEFKIIDKAGNTYSYKNTKLDIGVDKAKKVMSDNPEMTEKIEEDVREKMNEVIEDLKLKRVNKTKIEEEEKYED